MIEVHLIPTKGDNDQVAVSLNIDHIISVWEEPKMDNATIITMMNGMSPTVKEDRVVVIEKIKQARMNRKENA